MARPYRLGVYAMLVPFLSGAFVLVLVPLALSGVLALTAYDGLSAPRWRGLGNFRDLLTDPLFAIAVRNSLVFVALTVPLRLVITLGLALLLRRPRPGVGLYRVAVYLPTVVPAPAYALVWLWILNPLYGPLNLVLAAAGLPAPAWLADGGTALPAIALIALFQVGEAFVVLLAGLQEIPDEYYHAAALDGAGPLGQLRHLTLPLLAPWLLLVTIRDVIASVQTTFTPAFLMTGGGPYYATLFLPLLIYETAFDRLRFGVGAAMTVVVVAGVAALVALTYLALGGWGYEDEA